MRWFSASMNVGVNEKRSGSVGVREVGLFSIAPLITRDSGLKCQNCCGVAGFGGVCGCALYQPPVIRGALHF